MIDLRSDTVTLPSDEMRQAAHDAEVGDDVYGGDPTVNELEARAAELFGKEAGLFVPSGTMGNQIAARVHTEPGQEALVDAKAHVYKWEVGGFAQLSSLQVRAYDAGERGAPTPEQVREHLKEESLHIAGTGLLCLENTHNARGGIAIPKADIDAAAQAAHDHGVPVHLDGARVLNACVALDEDPADMAEHVDSVMFCLSKGLGAPVGSMLVGTEEFIAQATRVRKQFGGGMRQAGIIAAPGLVALDNVERLADDHENAKILAEGLDAVEGLSVPTPDTNIVVVDSEEKEMTSDEFVALCESVDVLGGGFGEYHTRLTTNLNVSQADVEEAVERIGDAVESR
ncbi:threonine aldolase family protein [Haloferax namakaokahaiae]|uniref:Threonine aldolase family protein n=1 Tax=Haloferax namakaokahaiae TaxID=1748331 RepID=A0ABD5ZIU0_9EURY